jgi:hypothetical protein
MANLFLKPELQTTKSNKQRPTKLTSQVVAPKIIDVGNLEFSPTVEYQLPIDVWKISSKTGSKRAGKEVYSLTDLSQITLGLFGFKHQQGTAKHIITEFLLRPENLEIIHRHNEIVVENQVSEPFESQNEDNTSEVNGDD